MKIFQIDQPSLNFQVDSFIDDFTKWLNFGSSSKGEGKTVESQENSYYDHRYYDNSYSDAPPRNKRKSMESNTVTEDESSVTYSRPH